MTIRSSWTCAGAALTANKTHAIARKKRVLADFQGLTLSISKLLAEIGAFLQRHGFQAFLQSIASNVVSEEDGNEEQGRQEHPPIRRQNVVSLQSR